MKDSAANKNTTPTTTMDAREQSRHRESLQSILSLRSPWQEAIQQIEENHKDDKRMAAYESLTFILNAALSISSLDFDDKAPVEYSASEK
jgi:hypothetical protein